MEQKGKKKSGGVIALLCVLAVCVGVGIWAYQTYFTETSDEEVYVTSVSTLMGNLENGMRNRYQGVVESNSTWTAQLDPEKPVKEYKVKVGDMVEVGTELLEYDNSSTEESVNNAKMDLQRLQDELAALNGDINELNIERGEATDELAAEELLLEIQQKQLDIRSKGTEIEAKQQEITKLEQSMQNPVVTSQLAGVVKSLGTDEESTGLTIVDVNTFQVKGRVNEQNLQNLYEGEKVIVFSRVSNDIHWKGKITKIDTDNAVASGDYDDEGDEMTTSSNYPFHIALKKTDGLAVGQHVYIEENVGQLKENAEEVIEISSYLIDGIDTDSPFVWVSGDGNRLEKRNVTLGEYNDEADKYRIEDGLSMTDLVAQPDEKLVEGMKTVNSETAEQSEDEDSLDEGLDDDEDDEDDEE